MPKQESYTIRLAVSGGQLVRAELGSVGKDGEQAFKRIESSGKGASRTIGDLSGLIVTRLVPAFSAMKAGQDIIKNIQQFELIDTRLKRLAQSTDDYAQIQDYLKTKSNELNIGIVGLAENYARLLALQESGIIDRGQVNELAEGFANLKAALGVDDSKIGDVLYGLSQALSQGTVQAQELNQVIEPLPGFLNKLDEAAGLASGGFRRLVNDGQVTSDMFRDVLLVALKDYEGAAVGMSDTSVAAVTRLNNAWIELSRTLGESFIIDALAGIATELTKSVDGMNTVADTIHDTLEPAYTALAKALALYVTHAENASKIDLPPTDPGTTAADVAAYTARLKTTMNGVGGLADGAMSGRLNPRTGAIEGVYPPKPGEKPQEIIDKGFKLQEDEEKKQVKAANDAADAIRKVTEELRFRNEQVLRSARDQEVYNQIRAAGVEIDSAAGQEIKRLVDEQYNYIELQELGVQKMEALQKASENTKGAFSEMGASFSSAFEEAIISGEKFSDVLLGIAQDIQRIMLRKAVTDPLANAIGSFIGGAFAGGASLNAGAQASYNPGAFQYYAKGGITHQPAIFGEAGPEAAVPLPDGRRIPVDLKGGGQGDVKVNVTLINKGAPVEPVSQTQTRGADGSINIEMLIDQAVARNIGAPGSRTNQSLQNFGQTRRKKG